MPTDSDLDKLNEINVNANNQRESSEAKNSFNNTGNPSIYNQNNDIPCSKRCW